MSGGYFDYAQYHIQDIVEKLEKLIDHNDDPDWYADFTPKTLVEFKTGLELLKRAYVYTQRIDWLKSGDDGEDSFHRRLKEDLAELK